MKPFIPQKLPINEYVDIKHFVNELLLCSKRITEYNLIFRKTVANKNLLLNPICRREAIFSTRIEGTQATLDDMYEYEAKGVAGSKNSDICESINYFIAIDEAKIIMKDYPISTRLFKHLHKTILSGEVRGSSRDPGEYRKVQNYIGADGANIKNAIFIPPPPNLVNEYISNLEKYINDEIKDDLSPLIKIAIIHAQFETIHPFLDGNGRLGRVLVPLYLYQAKEIDEPNFFVSQVLEEDKYKYYQLLNNTRRNTVSDWSEWIKFFLESMLKQAARETLLISKIDNLYDETQKHVRKVINTNKINDVIDYMFENPILTTKNVKARTGMSYTTINSYLSILEKEKILFSNGAIRNKKYYFYDLLNLVR